MMQQQPAQELAETQQPDFIHDLTFDHFGRRIATCSSDQTIKIWQRSENGRWYKSCSFPAHEATIFKVKWSNPDFGSILASCSSDKSVIIWEEKLKGPSGRSLANSLMTEEDENTTTFIQRAKFTDSKETIEDIKFGPKSMGLVIATASADGYMRIYKASDLVNMTQWTLNAEIRVNSLGINSISWNKNPPPDTWMVIIGAKDANTSFMNKSTLMKGQISDQFSQTTTENVTPLNEDKLLMVYIGREKDQKEKETIWSSLGELRTDDVVHKNAVNDVSWSLLGGRSYHILASCGKDGVFIWYVRFEEDEGKNIRTEILRTQILNNNVTVWKVSWNIMATLLSYSAQDHKVRICKCGPDRKWVVATEFESEEFEEDELKANTSLEGQRYTLSFQN